jgi:hypothetical protein
MLQLRWTVKKSGRYWEVACAALAANTQGTSRADALEMAVDWVRSMLDRPDLVASTEMAGEGEFLMTVQEVAPVLALIAARCRAAAGLTQTDIAKALGLAHKGTVAQAEAGKNELGFTRLAEILGAAGFAVVLDVAPVARAKPATKRKKGRAA